MDIKSQTTDTPHVIVFPDRCVGCQECVVRCPTKALSMNHERWIAQSDDSLCVGCGQCVRTCPFSAIDVKGPLLVAPRTELIPIHSSILEVDTTETRPSFTSWDQAIAEAERCLVCPDPTCMRGCPAHNDIPGFIKGLQDGDLEQSHKALRKTSVLPDVCSRVCDYSTQCEGACTWTLAGGQPVAIGAIERFISDNSPVPGVEIKSEDAKGLSIAIVGSGPAGVAAAWTLVEASASVTIYEKEDKPLGVLRWGIPDFTLPQRITDRPWDQLQEAGVDVRLSSPVYPEDLDTLLEQYDGIILCQGATHSRNLPVEGSDLQGVEDATSFLERGKAALAEGKRLPELAAESSLGEETQKNVFVLGAGDTAMDVCRTARRMGANVVCLNRRDREHARVRPDELAEAEAEGVEMRFSTSISKLEGSDGKLTTVFLAPTKQRKLDVRGALSFDAVTTAPPEVLADRAVPQAADIVVSATGYLVDPSFVSAIPGIAKRRKASKIVSRRWKASGMVTAPSGNDTSRRTIGRLALNRETDLAATRLPFKPRIWVAGDALTGPATVVEAMSQGREAADAVILDRPRRNGQNLLGGPRRVLVAYESETGKTKQAGTTLAGIMGSAGSEVRAMHLRDVDMTALAWADLVIVGSWVEGFVVVGTKPAKGARSSLEKLPHLAGKKVVLYCTYAVSPGKSLSIMRKAFEAKGATVVAEEAFSGRSLTNGGPDRFGKNIVNQLWPQVRGTDVVSKAKALFEEESSNTIRDLLWYCGGRKAVLEEARHMLHQKTLERSDDFISLGALRLIEKTLTAGKERPVIAPGSLYSLSDDLVST